MRYAVVIEKAGSNFGAYVPDGDENSVTGKRKFGDSAPNSPQRHPPRIPETVRPIAPRQRAPFRRQRQAISCTVSAIRLQGGVSQLEHFAVNRGIEFSQTATAEKYI
jgi:hypothetical protein